MRFAIAWVLLFALLPLHAQQRQAPRGRSLKEVPELVVVEFKVHREPGNTVSVEGHIRNESNKRLRGLVVFFEFLEADNKMISRKNILASEDELPPGEDCEFLAQTPDPVRAISVRLAAEDRHGMVLLLDKPGPYVIE